MSKLLAASLGLLLTACVPAKPITETNFISITLCNSKLEGVIVINSNGDYKAIPAKDLTPEIFMQLHDNAPKGHDLQLDIAEDTICGGS